MIYRNVLMALVVLVCFAVPAHAAELTLHGSTAVTSNLINYHKEAIEKKSGHTLKVISNGSLNGIKGVNAGDAQIGMISAPLDVIIEKVNKKAPGAVADGVLVAHKVGEARVAFTTHKSNNIKSLTRSQVADILSGKITKWSELGGPKFPILIIAEKVGGGVRSVVEDELLNKEVITGKMRELPNATQIPKVVAKVPAALGVMSEALVTDNVGHIILDKEIVQPLIFVTKGKPTAEAAAVINAAKAVTTAEEKVEASLVEEKAEAVLEEETVELKPEEGEKQTEIESK